MAIKINNVTVINDQLNIENIGTINGVSWAEVVANAAEGAEVDLNELTDVSLGTLATGEVLYYDGTNWVNTGLQFSDISGFLSDAQVAESNVTQHQAALSITESQISDLDKSAGAISYTNTTSGLTATTTQAAIDELEAAIEDAEVLALAGL